MRFYTSFIEYQQTNKSSSSSHTFDLNSNSTHNGNANSAGNGSGNGPSNATVVGSTHNELSENGIVYEELEVAHNSDDNDSVDDNFNVKYPLIKMKKKG